MATTAALRGPRPASTTPKNKKSKAAEPQPLAVAAAASNRAAPKKELIHALHWTRPDGTPCFTPGRDAALTKSTWQRLKAWVRELGDKDINTLARVAADRNGRPATETRGIPKPAPSYHCATAQRTVLRTDWSPQAAQLAIDWSRPEIRVELTVGRDVILSGIIPPQIIVGRQKLTPTAWRENYWVPDDEADAIELEMQCGDVRVQRQFVLSRRDGLLWIADAVVTPSKTKLECSLSLPFAPTASFQPAAETRETVVAVGKRRLLCIPPSLAEWRSERRSGELIEQDGALVLRQISEQATATYAPLCVVFDSRKAKRECTWRQLTVGEDMKIQPADRAVGYRLQIDRDQWLVYRSLTSRANRSLLGVNLQDDFLWSRLKKDGAVETIMGIEDD